MRPLLVALALIILVPRAEAQYGMEKVAFTIIVSDTDTKQQHKAIQNSLDALVTGQNCEGVGQDRFCEYYTLNSDPTKHVLAIFIINGDVATNLGNDLEKADTMYLHYTVGTTMTREQLRERAAKIAYRFYGATSWALIEAGQDLSNILDQIVPLSVPL